VRQLDQHKEEGLVDEFDEALRAYQTLRPMPETGARWDLPAEAFARWWGALVEEDRNEFMYAFGGDIILARMVAAYDYLVSREGMAANGAPIVLAYAIAAGLDPHDKECKIRAAKAWKSDAVQNLIDRLRYRGIRQAGARITNAMTLLLERSLSDAFDAPLKDRAAILNSALSLMKIMSTEDVAERAERSKRGFIKARGELGDGEEVDVTEDQATLYAKAIEAKFPGMLRKALEA
jgi:hypothetical protein